MKLDPSLAREASISLNKIERALAKLNLTDIHRSYNGGRISSFVFDIEINNKRLTIRLPFRWEVVQTTHRLSMTKAYDTTCHIMANWVEDSVDMVLSRNVHVVEIFLPFIYSDRSKSSFFDEMVKRNFEALR